MVRAREKLEVGHPPADIKEKGLLVGIPAKPLPWFGTFLQRVREISESEKVAITIQFVEGLEGETLEK